MRTATAALLAFAIALAGPVHAQAPTREAALERLKSADPVERRRAIVQLAQAGTMDDVPVLLERLRDSDDGVREIAERAIWVLWSRSGNPQVDTLFLQGIDQMSAGQFQEGIATFSRVIELAPAFAEGWNKRATLYFLSGDLQRSLRDCDEVMKRNPNHFGALAGYGQIYMQLGDYGQALAYFRRALAINPNLEGVEFQIRVLERLLEERGKKT
ncbi:MAG TPA: tetratricopeptide repeat protein [Burkholderiales bacterium]|nr:tetratricopeptide repeat protein [Burkholderiales bacterium]